jgi:hypothetical protein
MLSWTFAAALGTLMLLAASLPLRIRRLALPAASVAAVAIVWDVPLVPLLGVTLAVYALGRVLPGSARAPAAPCSPSRSSRSWPGSCTRRPGSPPARRSRRPPASSGCRTSR